MAKISKTGGPSFTPDEHVVIRRAEIGYEQPIAEPTDEDHKAVVLAAQEEDEKLEDRIEKDEKPSPRKQTGRK